VLVAQDRRRVELFTRTGETWNLMIIRPPRARVALPAIDAELTMDEIYEDSGA
jgi:hypothetical protein